MNSHPRLLVIAACLVACAPVFAQSSAGGGTILGTVKDATGAAIPGAKVTVTHLESGVATATVANQDGYFSTPTLKIGKYKVRVEAAGMKNWEGELLLETGRTAAVEPVLSVGQVSETITVNETVPLVNTTDATDGSTLDSKRIEELPINGRDMNTLIADVTPGVEQVIDVNGGVRTAGMMVYSTTYVQDGAASNNREFGGSMNLQGLESIAEVRVETSTSSAKYSSPASVIVSTKGGGNQVHGAVFETASQQCVRRGARPPGCFLRWPALPDAQTYPQRIRRLHQRPRDPAHLRHQRRALL